MAGCSAAEPAPLSQPVGPAVDDLERQRGDFLGKPARGDGVERALMAAQGERVLRLAADAALAGVVLGHEAGAEIDVRVTVDERRVRRDLVAAHRHQAHRLGAAGNHGAGKPAHDSLGREGDRLESGRAEAIDRDGRCVNRHTGAQARDARDVEPLLRLRHGAPEYHVIDLGGLDAGRAAERLLDDRRGHLVGPDGSQRAGRRLADRGPRGGNDYCILHEKSPSNSSSASPTSPAWPSNRWFARSISMSSFGSRSPA